jgi:hypothetical protein
MTATNPTIPARTVGIIGFTGLRVLRTLFCGNDICVYIVWRDRMDVQSECTIVEAIE